MENFLPVAMLLSLTVCLMSHVNHAMIHLCFWLTDCPWDKLNNIYTSLQLKCAGISTQNQSSLVSCVMSRSSLGNTSCRFKVMVAESGQFDNPGDILINKHELLFPCDKNSCSKQCVQ